MMRWGPILSGRLYQVTFIPKTMESSKTVYGLHIGGHFSICSVRVARLQLRSNWVERPLSWIAGVFVASVGRSHRLRNLFCHGFRHILLQIPLRLEWTNGTWLWYLWGVQNHGGWSYLGVFLSWAKTCWNPCVYLTSWLQNFWHRFGATSSCQVGHNPSMKRLVLRPVSDIGCW